MKHGQSVELLSTPVANVTVLNNHVRVIATAKGIQQIKIIKVKGVGSCK